MESQKPKNEKEIIQLIYEVCRNGLSRSVQSNKWFKERKLHLNLCGAGYNSGQWTKSILQNYYEMLVKVGYLRLTGEKDALGKEQCKVFGKTSVVFPLKNEQGAIVNLYAVRVGSGRINILNEEGLYPCYPSPETRRLFVTHNVEAAVVIIENGILAKDEAVLSLFDGEIKAQHKAAIAKLKHLEEIIMIEGAFAVKKIEIESEN